MKFLKQITELLSKPEQKKSNSTSRRCKYREEKVEMEFHS